MVTRRVSEGLAATGLATTPSLTRRVTLRQLAIKAFVCDFCRATHSCPSQTQLSTTNRDEVDLGQASLSCDLLLPARRTWVVRRTVVRRALRLRRARAPILHSPAA